LALALALSKKCEADKPEAPTQPDPETALLLGENGVDDEDDHAPKESKRKSFASILPSISPESRLIVVNLCLLFALDALASGLVPLSWVTAFFKRKFGLQDGVLGSLFFTTSIIAAASMLVASSIAKRIGNIKTMVFTHLPSAIALALIPIPENVHFAMLFLILRSCTQSMDVAPRSAFLAAVILPNERTAVMGMINVVKTFSSSIGPSITGFLSHRNLIKISFLLAGALKATYDLGVLAVFAGHEMRENQAKKAAAEAEAEAEANGEAGVQNGNGD
jgi:MFS family permease